ncbi:uncharacterized protein LOC121510612 [Cheilinus undulatus]|uniref:uncharacterized protein LOC121510612 n=1 Tax=Cheilinus undulatus TaxID=241271 RepID=UPI001BD496F9|nr:uncharacterized protein LOC121510612 [Cheilinus undulatus]XP_041644675.1 uncharacterized protein LOC121510612 [Cheilinus undulatus]XP_041644676.1 uncharacterized protein LOC121510612 [Cheilinus undulatus]XP_041644677.1 uncharacterized protein LOC121510612 [Cheilinus undulatus]
MIMCERSIYCFVPVHEKFLIPEDRKLKVTDDQGTEVDEDVFPELATVKDICFIICIDDDLLPADLSKKMADTVDLGKYITLTTCDFTLLWQGEASSSPSLTDTLSISTLISPRSDTSDAGCQIVQPKMDSISVRNMVEQILTSKPAGMTVIKEYEDTGPLKDSTRRLMVNILVAHMREKKGRAVNKTTKEFHALGIVSLFPSLKDPYSKKEHFYDIQSNTGFLEWRVKTVQHQSKTASTSIKRAVLKGGPTSSRTLGSIDDQQSGDNCIEAMFLLYHTTNHDLVFQKMRETFLHGQHMIHDRQQSGNILQMFPRFLDTKGLILQDFIQVPRKMDHLL